MSMPGDDAWSLLPYLTAVGVWSRVSLYKKSGDRRKGEVMFVYH
jgi:hypothetical protein